MTGEIDADYVKKAVQNMRARALATVTEMMEDERVRAAEAAQQQLKAVLRRRLRDDPVSRLRVVFLLAEPTLWDVYAPIVAAMQASERFAPLVVAFERQDIQADKGPAEIQAFLDGLDCETDFARPGDDGFPAIADLEPDIVFYTLGTFAFPKSYQIEFVSRFCLTCYISYGFLLVNEQPYQFGQSFHHAAWLLFASTERELAEYRARSKRLTPNAVLTGYPKFDLYPTPVPPPPARPFVIWSPHWTIKDLYPALKIGNFSEIYGGMAALMERRNDIDFLFKPHPNLAYACEKTGVMSLDAYAAYIDGIRALPNADVGLAGDNINRFVASSAMITDSVSFLAEYLPSGRPLLFMNRPGRTPFSDVGERIIASYYQGRTVADAEAFLDLVVAGEDAMAEARRQTATRELNIDERTASAAILERILIELAPVSAD